MPRRSVRLTVRGDQLRSVFGEIRVRLEQADLATRTIRFTQVGR